MSLQVSKLGYNPGGGMRNSMRSEFRFPGFLYLTQWLLFDCRLCCFGKQSIECPSRRVKNRLNAYGPEAVGLVEKTIVEARATPETGLYDDSVVGAEGAKPQGLRWAKYRNDGDAKSCGDMHGTAVIADKESAVFEHRHKLT